jgi:hypothetical protein
MRLLGQEGSFSRVSFNQAGEKTIEFGGAEQSLNDGGSLTCPFRAGEQPILFARGHRANAVFDRIIVDRQIAGFGVTTERGPAF